MKLKKVDRNEWQKCCRWCRNFSNGECHAYAKDVGTDPLQLYKVVEEGHLDETLEETLMSAKLLEFRPLLNKLREWKTSEKRVKEFSELFSECYQEWVQNEIKDMLSDSVDMCYINHASGNSLVISDPENYCCNRWC